MKAKWRPTSVMAHTKQTAHKMTGGKSVATYPKQLRKVILQYSSKEDGDQQVPGVELGKLEAGNEENYSHLTDKAYTCDAD